MSTPGVAGHVTQSEQEFANWEASCYITFVGKRMWIASERLDLMYNVKERARHVMAPLVDDWVCMKRVLRYVRGSRDLELQVKHRPGYANICVVVDANLGRAQETIRRLLEESSGLMV